MVIEQSIKLKKNGPTNSLYRFSLIFALTGIAIIFSFHSILWHSTGISSSIAVYGMKLVAVITLIPLLLGGIFYFPKEKNFLFFNFLFFLVLLSSVISALLQDYFSLFYFIADLIGFSLFWFYVQFGYKIRVATKISTDEISRYFKGFLLLLSFIIIAGFIQSGGEKVSIPPDMHYAIIFCFLCLFLKNGGRSLITSILFLSIVLLAAYLSLHRITLGAVVFSAISLLFISLKNFSFKNIFVVFFITLLSIYMILIYGSDLAVNFIVSANESGDGFSDPSANQRILETGLIINEINNSPLISQLLGKGFGAHYFNPGIIQHYPEYVHQGHPTPLILWLRNGSLGVILFLFLFFLSLKKFLSRKLDYVIYSAPLLYCCLASFFDLYVYWGFFMGIGTGLLFGQIKIDKSIKSKL